MYFEKTLKTRRYFGQRGCNFNKSTKEVVMDHFESICSAKDDFQMTSQPQIGEPKAMFVSGEHLLTFIGPRSTFE